MEEQRRKQNRYSTHTSSERIAGPEQTRRAQLQRQRGTFPTLLPLPGPHFLLPRQLQPEVRAVLLKLKRLCKSPGSLAKMIRIQQVWSL